MKREQEFVGKYYRLAPRDRLDRIYANFDNFPGIIADYELEMSEWIKDNLARARRQAVGELGVRIQTSNFRHSITEDTAIENLEIERIIKETDLGDGSWDKMEDSNEIMRGLLEIKLMRQEYHRFKSKLRRLSTRNQEIFISYLNHQRRTPELSDYLGISQISVFKRIYRIKQEVYKGFLDRLDSYDDETIFRLEAYDYE